MTPACGEALATVVSRPLKIEMSSLLTASTGRAPRGRRSRRGRWGGSVGTAGLESAATSEHAQTETTPPPSETETEPAAVPTPVRRVVPGKVLGTGAPLLIGRVVRDSISERSVE